MHIKLITKGRYAVTGMLDLAMRCHRGPVVLATIGQRQDISQSYLEELFGVLGRHGLVTSVRGKGGGYLLGRPAEQITVADIVVAVDKPIAAIGCGGEEHCEGAGTGLCMTQDLWVSLTAKLIDYLAAVSLKDLADVQLAKGVSIEEAPIRRVRRAISSQPAVKPLKLTAPNSVFALAEAFAK